MARIHTAISSFAAQWDLSNHTGKVQVTFQSPPRDKFGAVRNVPKEEFEPETQMEELLISDNCEFALLMDMLRHDAPVSFILDPDRDIRQFRVGSFVT